ncbi:TPA: hypothetical protein JAZ57_13055 [Legionella pneumophila]|nr:hypothetical protein [Legionella pneumophila]
MNLMKKVLRFEMKQNLRRPTRIYVKSPDLKTSYGYFHADNPSSFDGWSLLTEEQTTELALFIQNINAINALLGSEASNKLMDFRFRLPIDFVTTLHELTSLFNHQNIKYNFFEAALTGIIQQMKMATVQLDDGKKQEALTLLDKIGLATYKKLDLTSPVQAVFSELLAVHNKSEKLHKKALALFDKDKSYSPKAIEGMASGESQPARWLVACAIDVLIEERLPILERCLNDNELFLLWAKPLLDNEFNRELLLNKIRTLSWYSMEQIVVSYHPKAHSS